MFKRIGINGQTTIEKILSYSPWSIGLRSPYSPTGIILRETGQADLYAGLSRIILGTNGNSAIFGDLLGIRVSKLVLKTPSIEDVKFAKGHFNSVLDKYPKVFKSKVDLKGLYIMGPESYIQVDTSSGKGAVVNPVQLLDVVEEIELFSPNNTSKSLRDNYVVSEIRNLI